MTEPTNNWIQKWSFGDEQSDMMAQRNIKPRRNESHVEKVFFDCIDSLDVYKVYNYPMNTYKKKNWKNNILIYHWKYLFSVCWISGVAFLSRNSKNTF